MVDINSLKIKNTGNIISFTYDLLLGLILVVVEVQATKVFLQLWVVEVEDVPEVVAM